MFVRRLNIPLIALFLIASALDIASAQAPSKPAPGRNRAESGQFFTVDQPIRSEVVDRLKAATRTVLQAEANRGRQPILIFEIRPGKSDFGTCYDLAQFLSERLAGARKTVAYVPEPLTGYAVLLALACDEVVMGPGASIGPITPTDEPVNRSLVELVSNLARAKGRPIDLAVGMLDRDADLRRVRTAEGRVDYVLARNLEEYRKFHQILEDQPAWEAGARGVLTADRARGEGFARQLAEDRADVADAYGLNSTSNDPTLVAEGTRPLWIKVDRVVDSRQESFLRRQIAEARDQDINLLIFQFDTVGGDPSAVDALANIIDGLDRMKTVAYLDAQALGVPTIMALACDEIVFADGSKLGNVDSVIERRGNPVPLSDRQLAILSDRAAALARKNGYPEAVARAMVDPSIAIVEALDQESGGVVLVPETEAMANPDRFALQGLVKPAGSLLTIVSKDAEQFRISNHVVEDTEQLKELYGLRGRSIRINAPTWVDALVTTLNTPWMTGFLLFLGLFMLVLELKLPGIGLPAITAVLAFLLFFWSRYLGGTADQLEIILFVVGLICLALELFVFPGFGVFGMSGVVLVLSSVVMASHTFVWPTEPYEYQMMGRTLLQLVLTLIGVVVGAIIIGRFFPSLPLFNRLVLRPTPYGDELEDPMAKPSMEGFSTFDFLLGEQGRTTTVLRPTGKARFGDMLVDVTADGFYIEPHSLVEVIEVHGSRVVVRKVS